MRGQAVQALGSTQKRLKSAGMRAVCLAPDAGVNVIDFVPSEARSRGHSAFSMRSIDQRWHTRNTACTLPAALPLGTPLSRVRSAPLRLLLTDFSRTLVAFLSNAKPLGCYRPHHACKTGRLHPGSRCKPAPTVLGSSAPLRSIKNRPPHQRRPNPRSPPKTEREGLGLLR